MGRTRTAPSEAPSPPVQGEAQSISEEEVAAAIAAILAGQLALPAGVTLLAAITTLLGALPDAPDGPVTAATARAAARLVLEDPPKPPGRSEALRVAYADNLLYRAWYGVNAAKRLAASVSEGDDLRAALSKELAHYHRHREANAARTAGAKLNAAAAERWGPVLSWNHSGKEHFRPHHKAADGKNYRVDRPPVSTEGLPGTLLHCGCAPGPPKPNGEMLR
jgi:hypothetical protein